MDPAVRQSRGSRAEIGLLLLGLLLAGIALWSVILPQAEKAVFGRVPILDEIYYLDRAVELGGSHLCPDEPCFMSPLYPQLIRLAGSNDQVPEQRVMASASLRGIRLFQIGCWLGTVVLLGWIGWRDLVPPGAGRPRRLLIAATPALLFFLYRPAVAYTTTILVEIPLTFLVLALLALLPGRAANPGCGLWRFLAAGVVLGLAGLLRGTVLVLLPLALWWVWRYQSGGERKPWPAALVMASAVVLILAVPVMHNSRLAGGLRPPTLNGGVNLYIGNGPLANGLYVAAVPGDWREDPAGRQFLGAQSGAGEMSLDQADRIWLARAVHAMSQNPGRVVLLWARKFWLHLQGWEIDQLLPLKRWSEAVPSSRVLGLPYGLLVAVGLGYGLWKLRRPAGSFAAGWMLGLLLIISLQSVFFVVSRYRLVLVPGWALLATAAIFDESLKWRTRGLLVVAGLLVVVPWGTSGVRNMWSAMAGANEARRWSQVGLVAESASDLHHARDLYLEALAGGAPGPIPWQGLVAVDHALGDKPSSLEDLDHALQVFPTDLVLRKQRVSNLLAAHQEKLAQPLILGILADHPRDADTLHNAAVLFASRGDRVTAMRWARQLMEFHPGDARGFVDLGVMQARSGQRDLARQTFERGLVQNPDSEVLQKNLMLLGSP